MEQNKILIADDNPQIRGILKRLFETEYEIVQAENGNEALELYRANRETLAAVLLDLNMPEYDGMYFLEQLTARYPENSVPVVCVTGDERESSLIQAYAHKVNSFISKPFNTDYVRRVVRSAVENSERHTEYDTVNLLSRLTAVLNRCHADIGAVQTALEILGAYLGADRVSLYMRPMQSELFQWCRKTVPGSYWQTYRWMLRNGWDRDWTAPEEWMMQAGPAYGNYKQYEAYYKKYAVHGMTCLKLEGIRKHPAFLIIENAGGGVRDVVLLSALQNLFSLAVKNAELTIVDQKTGVYNRRLYTDYMNRLTKSNHKSLGVIVMNLNSMHQYIATYGQAAGDELLERTAELVGEQVGGACFRTGGDEFTAIVRDGSREDVESLMNRISAACREQNIGLSMGYAWQTGSGDPEELYKAADRNMREAKKKHYSSLNVTKPRK
ncbi:MAG: diguanylate cyclase response regulator [Oscillospiraceae bacterium]|nr:diguanylate cyclase response regulator [Oscillospiraceae bacterium]